MSQDLFSYDFLSVEDIRVKQGIPGIIPLQTGHINGKNFPRARLCCVSFSVEEMLVSAFPIYFPQLLKETVNSQ